MEKLLRTFARSFRSGLSKRCTGSNTRYFPVYKQLTRTSSVYSSASVVADASSLPRLNIDDFDTSESCIRSVLPNGLLCITGVPDAAFGTLVNVYSTVPGIGPVPAIVVRIHERECYAALYTKSHHVNIGDRVSVPSGNKKWPTFPVGSGMLGRVVSPDGRALDGKGPVGTVGTRRLDAHGLRQSTPPLLRRDREGPWVPTGIRHMDLFHPLRRGLKVAVTDGSHEQQVQLAVNIVGSLAAQNQGLRAVRGFSARVLAQHNATAAPGAHSLATEGADNAVYYDDSGVNVFVWVAVNHTQKHVDSVVAHLERVGALASSTVVAADNNASPALQHQALLAGVCLAAWYRSMGAHCTLVVDDMASHAQSLAALLQVSSQPHPNSIASVQAVALEPVCAPEVAGVPSPLRSLLDMLEMDGESMTGSISALLLAAPLAIENGPKKRRHEMWTQSLLGMADHVVPLSADLSRAGLWPPVVLSQHGATLKYQPPVIARLARHLTRLLRESQDATTRLRMGQELGVSLDWDVEEVVEWRAKAELLLTQSPGEFVPIHIQYLSLFALAQPRLLAGVAPRDVGKWDTFLLEQAREHPTLLTRLRDEVNLGTHQETHSHPGANTGEWGLSLELEQDLKTLVDDTLNKYVMCDGAV